MSSSFRTTIGWGLPWFEFESLTTLDCVDKHIAFYPDCYHAGLWQRSDDELDLALHYWWEKNGSRSGETDNSTHVHYVRYGHGPWRTALMTTDGRPFDWVPPHELDDRPDVVPRVPLEIRWYLSKLGILDDAGINRLRPLTARWIAY
jgi:hypothetical protein